MASVISWISKEEVQKISTEVEVISLIEKLDKEYSGQFPIAVEIQRPDTAIILVIVGSDLTCLGYWPPGYEGYGSLHSLADGYDPDVDELRNDEEVLEFLFYGHDSAVPKKYCISKQIAYKAVSQFVTTNGIPNVIRWGAD